MNSNLKVTLASGLAFLVLVIPGLADVVHEAGGSTAGGRRRPDAECACARRDPSVRVVTSRDWRRRARAARLVDRDGKRPARGLFLPQNNRCCSSGWHAGLKRI